MKPIIPALVKAMSDEYKKDAREKGLMHDDLEKKLQHHKRFESLRADWAEKRVNSIFREVERYGITIKKAEVTGGWRGTTLKAIYQGVTMEGELQYRSMDMVRPYKPWRRPKIVATFWILDSNGNKCYLEGHIPSAFMIVFGAKRMLTYNRLMPAVLNAMAR
jgi:hypothetical protein